jgi:Mrp family chromosome partitioning ATPase
VDDGLFLAQLVDGVILVLNTGVVKEGEAKKAKNRLENSSGKILGVALNRFNEKVHGAGLHSYNSYYASPLKSN